MYSKTNMKSLAFTLVSLSVFTSAVAKAAKDDNLVPTFSLPVDNQNMKLTILEEWENLEKSLKNATDTMIKMALPKIMESSRSLKISSQCMREVMYLISGLKNNRAWAVRFLDSSGKILDGIIEGSFTSFGAYDECVDTVVKSKTPRNKEKVLFSGQYCTLDLSMPQTPSTHYYTVGEEIEELKNFSKGDTVIAEASKKAYISHLIKFRLGICIPSGCSLDDADKIAKMVGENMLGLNGVASRCELKQENDYPPIVITVITCYSFAGFLMLVGSLIDLHAYYRKAIYKNGAIRMLRAFSLITNFRKITNTQTSSDVLSCLNGIRFLSMSWIILCHTYCNVDFLIFKSLNKMLEFTRNFAFQAIMNGTVAVDTFFFIGGLLVCYVVIKNDRQQGHRFSIIIYIFHRLWRILPVYVFVIMFMFLGNFLGSGPIWYEHTHKWFQSCHDKWWKNLLFINNFYPPNQMCILQSWYISSDFQLYIGALFIILPMLRWPKIGILLCIAAVVASIVYSGVVTYINDYPPTVLAIPDYELMENYWANFYFLPFPHAGPYCVGILAGYVLATKPDIKIPPVFQVVGWSLAFIFNFSVLYGVVNWNRGTHPFFWSRVMYAALNRVAWALGVAWVVVCCCTKQAAVINYILSWKAFIPLSRLSYVAFLIHHIPQICFIGSVRTQIQVDHFLAVWVFFGNLCVTYAAALAGSMLIEAPFMSLEKILLQKNETKTRNISPTMENSIVKGTLKREENEDIAGVKWNKVDEGSGEIDNQCMYKL